MVVPNRTVRGCIARRGIATFWLLLFVPVFLVLLGLVVNVANLWLARVELENALEAAALAAVKEWVENPSSSPHPTAGPRAVGVAYAAANTVRGQPLVIDDNLHPSPSPSNPNANEYCCVGKPDPGGSPPVPPSGNLIFGSVYQDPDDPQCPNGLIFDASLSPDCLASPRRHHAVRAQAIVPVATLWSTILGSNFPKGYVTVHVTAMYECGANQPRLIHVDKFICP